ncbi:MAG: cystathionine beta-lyase, partial [Clostridia bacterium]|nr:cystathionine beta-lyase [Clostridia bacterium]
MEYRYDFDTVYDRRSTDSVKWAVGPDELPMWVADMDFRTAPEIVRALAERVEHGIFGYAEIPESWSSAYMSWWKDRHGLEMDREDLIFCTGVIAALSSIVRKLTTPNENVVIQPPVYNIFVNSTVNNGCRVLENPLRYDPDSLSYS